MTPEEQISDQIRFTAKLRPYSWINVGYVPPGHVSGHWFSIEQVANYPLQYLHASEAYLIGYIIMSMLSMGHNARWVRSKLD